jgi:alpha/beta superfamily hydrolase
MVSKGQFLERPTLIPVSGGLVLEGVAHRGERAPPMLVLPPPPIEGSGMDHVVGAELAYAASRQGHSTVRFNYRGVGGSQGKPSRSVDDWLDDARNALGLCTENAGGAAPVLVAIGASDAVALKLSGLVPVVGLAFVSPSILGPADLQDCALPLAVIVPELDDAVPRAAWSALLGEAFTIVPGATRGWQRNLPLVGKAVAALLQRVGGVDRK